MITSGGQHFFKYDYVYEVLLLLNKKHAFIERSDDDIIFAYRVMTGLLS